MRSAIAVVFLLAACGDSDRNRRTLDDDDDGRPDTEFTAVLNDKARRAAHDEDIARANAKVREDLIQIEEMTAPTIEQPRLSATAQLAKLRAERAELQARLAEARRQMAERPARPPRVIIRDDCKVNPLGRGCMQ
jgi:hypothetical protein